GAAYQQVLENPSRTAEITGLPVSALSECLLENKVNPLMAAGVFGHVNTVSPGYARELLSGKDQFSGILGAAYKKNRISLKGIYNGIDPGQWQTDSLITAEPKPILRRKLSNRIKNGEFPGIKAYGGSLNPEVPWIVFHGRLTPQKGVDSLLALPEGLGDFQDRFNFIIYGQGDSKIVELVKNKSTKSNDWFFLEGYNRELTVNLIASASFLTVPSQWEPCGQIDMIGQSLGALPIVRAVGGLKKVRHLVDGFKYSENSPEGLLHNLQRALEWEWEKQRKVSLMRRHAENIVYGRRIWRKILIRGYLPLYKKAQKQIKHRG
ncbi:MAG: glycosyltransferase, partial [Spirochaetaceae bacterium]|nr:glycosyltransferase [Spirochaetaceae bacterium]